MDVSDNVAAIVYMRANLIQGNGEAFPKTETGGRAEATFDRKDE